MNNIPIIYEDEEIFIINKPAGLAVQGGEKISHSLDEDFSKQVGFKVFLVHRLDKDTAGLMIVGKSAFAANKWTKLISSKIVKKEYIAICSGVPEKEKGIINEVVIQHGESKNASTKYNVEKKWSETVDGQKFDFCKVRLLLETGRMHQIRIHLAKQGCPICGDDQHGNFKLNKVLRKNFKIKQLLLAAVKLQLPIENQIKTFEIELPDHMQIESCE